MSEIDGAAVLGDPGHLADHRLLHQGDCRIARADHGASVPEPPPRIKRRSPALGPVSQDRLHGRETSLLVLERPP
ncbi:hypothetical protein RZS08_43815, partial [Arthrospira platensis SPKY1]|nr:hypothetical protein [Arthrospira platensis SPKY1]